MTLSKVSHEHLRWIPFDPELSENTTTRADIPFIISPITLSHDITSTHSHLTLSRNALVYFSTPV